MKLTALGVALDGMVFVGCSFPTLPHHPLWVVKGDKLRMKILVCGDRAWSSELIIKEYLEYLKPDLVIEGECRGADRIARKVAEELGIPVEQHPANWSLYGRAAGSIRNREMLDLNPDLVLAFHFNIQSSTGTADCLTEAERRGIPYVLTGVSLDE